MGRFHATVGVSADCRSVLSLIFDPNHRACIAATTARAAFGLAALAQSVIPRIVRNCHQWFAVGPRTIDDLHALE